MKIDKTKIKSFTRKDGSIGKSIDVAIWVETEPTEDWKAVSIQQSSKKEEPTIYLGNCKEYIKPGEQAQAPAPQGHTGAGAEEDDLPF